ncbi:MAG: DUF1836 domain-containing protein [Firmicutes bacterium]|jgi:hypothetical protein|nr:DUF1836 domain-containing protein [Bacillota bacterium]NBI62911.1 DUF1836 domain-containing protein [Clostridiales bacterium]
MEIIKKMLEEKRPNNWEDIPDIDLYMDQVLSYMTRQHVGLELDENLTSAMVNNYMKKDLLPRAKGKKYDRQHIAYLTAICLLKQVLSVTDAGELLKLHIKERKEEQVQAFYEKYMETMDQEFCEISAAIDEEADQEQLADLALRLAVSSYGQKLACQQILEKLEKGEK